MNIKELLAKLEAGKALTIDEMKAVANYFRSTSKAIVDEASEEKRELSDDESKQADEMLDKAEGLDSKIRKAEADAKREARIAAMNYEQPRAVQPVQPEAGVADAPMQKLVIPARARRGRATNFTDNGGMSAEEKAYKFGMWAIAGASQVLGRPHHRAIQFCNDYFPLQAAHSEGTNSAGGFLVHDQIDMDMIDLREKYGVARQILRRVPMSSDVTIRTRRTGGLTAYFVGEATAGTESTKSWDQIQLVAKKMIVLATMSSELDEDAAIMVGNDLAGEISYSFAEKEDDCALNGTGASTYGGIVGFRTQMTDTTYQVVSANSGTHTDWSQITLAELNNVVALLPEYAETPNTRWVVSKGFFGNVMQKLAHAAGGVTVDQIAGALSKTFMGYPVTISQKMPSAQGTAEVVALFGDFSLAADFGDRRGTTIDFSKDATINSVDMFATDQIAVRGTERFDINVHDVGDSTASGPVVGLLTAS